MAFCKVKVKWTKHLAIFTKREEIFVYINSGYLNNSRTDFKDNSTPLVVGSCGTYRLKTRPNLPTYWQKGRRDYQILYVANGKTHFWFDGKEEIVSAGHMVLYKPEEIQNMYIIWKITRKFSGFTSQAAM